MRSRNFDFVFHGEDHLVFADDAHSALVSVASTIANFDGVTHADAQRLDGMPAFFLIENASNWIESGVEEIVQVQKV